MTTHRRRLATLAALATLTALALASACQRVVELSTLDGGTAAPPFFTDARVIDTPSAPPDILFPDARLIDAGVSDGPFSWDAAPGVIDAPFAAPPPGSTDVRTRT